MRCRAPLSVCRRDCAHSAYRSSSRNSPLARANASSSRGSGSCPWYSRPHGPRSEREQGIGVDPEAVLSRQLEDCFAAAAQREQQVSHLARAQDAPPENGGRRVEGMGGIDRLMFGPDGSMSSSRDARRLTRHSSTFSSAIAGPRLPHSLRATRS